MATEKATLELELKSNGLEKNADSSTTALKELSKAGDDAKKKLGGGGLLDGLKSAGGELLAMGAAAGGVIGTVVGLGFAAKELLSSLVPLQEAQKVFQLKDGEKGVEILGEIRDFADDAGFEINKATEIAAKLGRAFDPSSAQELFKVIADARGNLGLSEQGVDQLTDKILDLGAKTKIGLGDFEQFAKVAGKGAPSFDQIAAATGATVQNVKDLLAKGELAPAALVQGFRKAQLEAGKTNEVGGSALQAAGESIESQFNRIGNQFTFLKQELAVDLLKAVGGVEGITKFVNSLAKGFKFLTDNADTIISALKIFGVVIAGIVGILGIAVVGVLTLISPLIALGYGIFKLVEHWQGFTDIIGKVGSAIGSFVSGAFNLLFGAVKFFVGLWLGLADILLTPIGGIQGLIDIFSSLSSTVFSVVSAIVGAVSGAVGSIVGAIASVVSAIWTPITDLASQAVQLGANIVQGLVNGILSLASAPVDALKSIANRGIAAAESALGIHSPSKVFAEIGGHTVEGFTQGVDANAPDAQESVSNLATGVIPTGGPATAGVGGGGGGNTINVQLTVNMDGVKDLPLSDAGDFFTSRVEQAMHAVLGRLHAQGSTG